MKPLHVLVLVKNKPSNFKRKDRQTGWWSYPVQEFTWEFRHSKGSLNTTALGGDFDLVVWSDGARVNKISGPVPSAAMIIDSTGSSGHFKKRYLQAGFVDLVLVDHDDLDRYRGRAKHVARCSYCINDKVFRDYGQLRTADVANHCNKGLQGNPHWRRRNDYFHPLREFCDDYDYTLREGNISNIFGYARSYNAARVGINFSRTPTNRPHRTYDVMAARSCLATTPLPAACGDDFERGKHYVEFHDVDTMRSELAAALATGAWQDIADEAHRHVHANHTWAIRAQQMRQLFYEVLGI